MGKMKMEYRQIHNEMNATPAGEVKTIGEFEVSLRHAFCEMISAGYDPRDVLSLAISELSCECNEAVLKNMMSLYKEGRGE